MKRLQLFLLSVVLSAVGVSCDFALAADELPLTSTTEMTETPYIPTATTPTSATTSYMTNDPLYHWRKVTMWHGAISIEYGQSFDFAEFLPFYAFYSVCFEIWGEEELTTSTDENGEFHGQFASCYLVYADISPGHFIITNWNIEPLTINEINMYLN